MVRRVRSKIHSKKYRKSIYKGLMKKGGAKKKKGKGRSTAENVTKRKAAAAKWWLRNMEMSQASAPSRAAPAPAPAPAAAAERNQAIQKLISQGTGGLINICVPAGKGIPEAVVVERSTNNRVSSNILNNIYDSNILYKNVSVEYSVYSKNWSVSWHDGEVRTHDYFGGAMNISEFIKFQIRLNMDPPKLLLSNFFMNGKKIGTETAEAKPKLKYSSKEDFNQKIKDCYVNVDADCKTAKTGVLNQEWSPSLLGMNLIYYFKNLLSEYPDQIQLRLISDSHKSNSKSTPSKPHRNDSDTFYQNYGFTTLS